MTTLRAIAVLAGAGEPDDVLPLRADVVAAARKLYHTTADAKLRRQDFATWHDALESCQSEICNAVKKLERAEHRRRVALGTTKRPRSA